MGNFGSKLVALASCFGRALEHRAVAIQATGAIGVGNLIDQLAPFQPWSNCRSVLLTRVPAWCCLTRSHTAWRMPRRCRPHIQTEWLWQTFCTTQRHLRTRCMACVKCRTIPCPSSGVAEAKCGAPKAAYCLQCIMGCCITTLSYLWGRNRPLHAGLTCSTGTVNGDHTVSSCTDLVGSVNTQLTSVNHLHCVSLIVLLAGGRRWR